MISGACHKVGSKRCRLDLLGELAVAVIHDDRRIGASALYGLDDLADLPGGYRASGRIASAALHKCRRRTQLRYAASDAGIIRPAAGGKLHLLIPDPERGKRAAAAARDGGMQRIIGRAGHGKERVARLKRAVKRAGNGVRSVDKRCAHERGFRAEHVGINSFERFAPQIVIAVPGRAGKARLGHTMRAERVQHLFRIILRRAFKAAENRLQAFFHAFRQRIKLFVIHGRVSFISVRLRCCGTFRRVQQNS